jgi:FKBP-type peptidyl-prolyl cis-trans isomerase FkpA
MLGGLLKADRMNAISRALVPFASVVILPLMLAQAPAGAAVRKAPVRAALVRAGGVKATAEIIPLPLNPVLPAGQRLCSAKTAAGLGYTVLRAAAGAKPAEADYVLVNYIGYLAATGAVFDQGVGASFPVNGVIPGFSQGLQTLAKTGIARFCIPAAMGYGAQEAGPIPANSDLVFQVELVDYKTAAEIEAMRKARAAAAAPKEGAVAPVAPGSAPAQ